MTGRGPIQLPVCAQQEAAPGAVGSSRSPSLGRRQAPGVQDLGHCPRMPPERGDRHGGVRPAFVMSATTALLLHTPCALPPTGGSTRYLQKSQGLPQNPEGSGGQARATTGLQGEHGGS